MPRLRIRIMSAIMLLAIMFCCLPIYAIRDENTVFEHFLYKQWKETIQSDYLTLHFMVKEWRELGYEKPELTLGSVEPEEAKADIRENEEVLEELHSFNRDMLSEVNKAAYDTLDRYLLLSNKLMQYPQFTEMFNPYNGVYKNIITNFTEFEFRCEEDVEDFLVLLADYDRLLEDMIAVTETQAAEGYFMPDTTLEMTLDDMHGFVSKGKENPLFIIFRQRVGKLGLDTDVAASYIKRNEAIINDEIFPAYEEAVERLERLKGSRHAIGGMCRYKEGLEYYNALVAMKSGTDMELEDMSYFLGECLEDVIKYVIMNMPEEVENVGFDNAEDILEYLANSMKGFPRGPEVTYEVSYLDPSVAVPSVAAYYLNAPVDDYRENIIRVNGDSITDINDLFMTLSHEGFPGHLYQNTYWLSSENMIPLIYITGSQGYDEGWAMYAEEMMIRNSGISSASASYLEGDELYGYLYSTIIDIGVNGFGWDYSLLWDFLDPDRIYYTEDEVREMMDYAISTAGNIIPYGVGDAMFLLLRARAQMSLGDRFDEVGFHKVLLDKGSRPFDVVEADVEQYVNSEGYEYQLDHGIYSIEMGLKPEPVMLTPEIPTSSISPLSVIIWVTAVLAAAVIAARLVSRRKATEAGSIACGTGQSYEYDNGENRYKTNVSVISDRESDK